MSTADRKRESVLAGAFVALADSLVSDYDPIDLLHQLCTACVRLLPTQAAGVLLADQWGTLRTVAASSEQSRLLDLFQVQADQGPCLDSFRDSKQVVATDLQADDAGRWPRFAEEAAACGFRAVHALPLRLRQETIGALNLFSEHLGAFSADELRIGQALADVATISVLQERLVRRGDVSVEDRMVVLNSRVIIEQAKGVLAETHELDMPTAFAALRHHARERNERLTDLAKAVVEGTARLPAVDQRR